MTRPNIVYIFCDELRIDALQCYGNPYTNMKTQYMDELAEHGILFENCFCNSPVCVPSRMSTLTGLYPEDTGVYHNEADIPPYQLEGCYTSIPQVLQEHGYQTASFGKTHLPRGFSPFQYEDQDGSSMSFAKAEKIQDALSPRKNFHSKIGGYLPEQEDYQPEHVVKNALSWTKQQKEPYFVRISFTQPHTPIIVKEPYQTSYDPAVFPDSFVYEEQVSEFEKRFAQLIGLDSLTGQELQSMYAYYYAMVHWIDDQIGLVMNYLRQEGQLENTLIILNADHGASRGENGCLAKQIFAPMSQRVPLIFSYPAVLAQGKRESKLCANIDLGKTLYGILGIEAPAQFKGDDLLKSEHDPYVYASIGYGSSYSYAFPAKFFGSYSENMGWPRRSCIRKGSYRLDMNTRINDREVTAEEEDLFFTDKSRYPKENVNLKDDPSVCIILQELKDKLLEHICHAKEIDAAVLKSTNNTLKAYRS